MKDRDDSGRRKNVVFVLKERYKRIIEMTFDAIISVDTKGIITLWNPAAERIFGYREKEVLGKPVELLVPPEYIDEHRRGLAEFSKTGKGAFIDRVTEVTGIRKGGDRVQVEMSISAAPVKGWLATGVLRDITERKRLEGELARRLDEAERLNRLMVGRELKMEKLQREVERLRSEIRRLRKTSKGSI